VGYIDLGQQVSMSGPFGPSIGWGMQFYPDGSKFYVVDYGFHYPTIMFCFELSNPWDVTTAVYKYKVNIGELLRSVLSSRSYCVYGFCFSPDGRFIYVSDGHVIVQFDLLSPWDIRTVSYLGKQLTLNNYDLILDFVFDPTGTTLYVGYDHAGMIKYNLSTPWDITTVIDINGIFCFRVPYGRIQSFQVGPDGRNLYVLATEANVFYYTLSIPWNIDVERRYEGICFNSSNILRSLGIYPSSSLLTNIRFNNNGTLCYITYRDSTKVFIFGLSEQ
jgi:DNA-binding beta-propeller fold protein YncE